MATPSLDSAYTLPGMIRSGRSVMVTSLTPAGAVTFTTRVTSACPR
jgi:hypothetical protein